MTIPRYLALAPWRTPTLPPPARTPERLLEVVAGLFLDDQACPYLPRLDNGVKKTFCNKVVSAATLALGCPVPDVGFMGGELREFQVLEQRTWLCGEGVQVHGWERLSGAHVAQAMADQGQVAVALWQGRTADHGHIALLVPSQGQPGTWIAQAGASVFSRGTVEQGFGALPVEYFGHA